MCASADRGFGVQALCLTLHRAPVRVILPISRLQPPALGAENSEVCQAEPLQCKLQCGAQHSDAVLHAAPEIDGGGIVKILGRTRYFSNTETETHTLRQHLIVKDEVVGI